MGDRGRGGTRSRAEDSRRNDHAAGSFSLLRARSAGLESSSLRAAVGDSHPAAVGARQTDYRMAEPFSSRPGDTAFHAGCATAAPHRLANLALFRRVFPLRKSWADSRQCAAGKRERRSPRGAASFSDQCRTSIERPAGRRGSRLSHAAGVCRADARKSTRARWNSQVERPSAELVYDRHPGSDPSLHCLDCRQRQLRRILVQPADGNARTAYHSPFERLPGGSPGYFERHVSAVGTRRQDQGSLASR